VICVALAEIPVNSRALEQLTQCRLQTVQVKNWRWLVQTYATDQIKSTDRIGADCRLRHLDVSILNIRTVSVGPELTQHTTFSHRPPQSSYKGKN